MKIKTLAEILAEQNVSVSHVEKTNDSINQTTDDSPSYFEDDPAFQEFISIKESKDSQATTKPSGKNSFNSNTHFKSADIKKRDPQKRNSKKSLTKAGLAKKNRVIHSSFKQPSSTKVMQTNSPIKSIADDVVTHTTSNQETNTRASQLDIKLNDLNSDCNLIDNLTTKLQIELKTPEQHQREVDEIKADARLRWLAFYYLSNREHSAQELKDKLLAKEQDAHKIDELLEEFKQKGYQSDMRTALMLIREGIRKGRGRRRIKQEFYKRKVAVPSNIDELIDRANEDSEEFADYTETDVANSSNGKEQVNWLKLAVKARVKKYGDDTPTEPKEKAKQLRFLQYRGFNADICFEALQHDLESVEEVF